MGARELTFVPFPFTLAYAAAVLESEGMPVMVLDAIGEDLAEGEYYRRICEFQPDLIVNETSTASFDNDARVARQLRDLTGATIVFCGPHSSGDPSGVLRHPAVDMVFLGEFEQTLPDLIDALERGRPLTEVKGLGFRTETGEIVINPRRELLRDLDELPWPHRGTLPLANYRVAGYPPPVMYMYASRGCPYQCTFCLWPQTMYRSTSYRVRSPKLVVQEVEAIQEQYGPFKSIYFDDDTFNVDHKRMDEFAVELSRKPWKIPFGCNARTDLFDERTLQRLSDVGLFNIRVGVESGDPVVLDRIKKNLDLDSVGRCIGWAHKYGVKVHVTFTIGLSGESWDSVEKTVAFARSISPDSMAFTITTPFPGTEYYDEVVNEGYLATSDWSRFNVISSAVIRTETMSPEDITRAEKYVMRKVYCSPAFLARRLRYAMSLNELFALARKGIRLFREPAGTF
jgi:radical SAM superfamily enzyme YgiQ (UPF0313 family)